MSDTPKAQESVEPRISLPEGFASCVKALRVMERSEMVIEMTALTLSLRLQSESYSERARELINEGIELAKEQCYDEAGENFLLAITEQPDNPFGYLNLGKILELKGRLDDAIELYKEAVFLGPEYNYFQDILYSRIEKANFQILSAQRPELKIYFNVDTTPLEFTPIGSTNTEKELKEVDRLGLNSYVASMPDILSKIESFAESLKILPSDRAEFRKAVLSFCKSPRKPVSSKIKEGGSDKVMLPAPPSGLSWPTETYSSSPEAKRGSGLGIVPYLERVWLPLIAAAPGTVSMQIVRKVDKTAARGIANYTQKKDPITGKNLALPAHLDIPTKPELTDRAAASAFGTGDMPVRVDWALRSRRVRARKKHLS